MCTSPVGRHHWTCWTCWACGTLPGLEIDRFKPQAVARLLSVGQLQVGMHDDADTLNHCIVHPVTIQRSQARVHWGLVEEAVKAATGG